MDYQPGLYEAASSDGRWHPCLFFSPIYSQEEFLHGLLSSSCGMEDAYFSSSCYNEDEPVYETYEGEEQLPYYSCGNWLSDFEHSVGHCWGDGYFSLGNETQENEDGSDLRKVEEDSGRCDQQDESSYEHEVREEAYPASNTWSFDSWFACAEGKLIIMTIMTKNLEIHFLTRCRRLQFVRVFLVTGLACINAEAV